jgi:hypothetical protein
VTVSGEDGDWPDFPAYTDPDILDELARLGVDLDPDDSVLDVPDEPDPHADRPPPGPLDQDGPQDVEPDRP